MLALFSDPRLQISERSANHQPGVPNPRITEWPISEFLFSHGLSAMLLDLITSGQLLIVCELYTQPLDRGPYITGTVIGRPLISECTPCGCVRESIMTICRFISFRFSLFNKPAFFAGLAVPTRGTPSPVDGRPMTVPTSRMPIISINQNHEYRLKAERHKIQARGKIFGQNKQ